MAVTTYDIARKLNVSQASVSMALRDDPRISLATRQRIQQAAKEVNYRPNLTARSLVRGKSMSLGFIVSVPFYEVVANNVIAVNMLAQEAGFSLSLASLMGRYDQMLAAAEELVSRGVDGLLVYGMPQDASKIDDEQVEKLLRLPLPMVFFDQGYEMTCLQVVQDRAAGAKAALKHLIGLGHRSIHMMVASGLGTTKTLPVPGFCRDLPGVRPGAGDGAGASGRQVW